MFWTFIYYIKFLCKKKGAKMKNMAKFLIIISIAFTICIAVLVHKNLKLEKELFETKKELSEIKIAPEKEFFLAKNLIENQEYEKGIEALNLYMTKFPCSKKPKIYYQNQKLILNLIKRKKKNDKKR